MDNFQSENEGNGSNPYDAASAGGPMRSETMPKKHKRYSVRQAQENVLSRVAEDVVGVRRTRRVWRATAWLVTSRPGIPWARCSASDTGVRSAQSGSASRPR